MDFGDFVGSYRSYLFLSILWTNSIQYNETNKIFWLLMSSEIKLSTIKSLLINILRC